MQHMNILYKRTESSMSHTGVQIRHNETNSKPKNNSRFLPKGGELLSNTHMSEQRAKITAGRITRPKTEVTLLHWVTGGDQNSSSSPHHRGTYSGRRRWGSAVTQTPARNGS